MKAAILCFVVHGLKIGSIVVIHLQYIEKHSVHIARGQLLLIGEA
jgi:hypothetical protein